MQAAGSVNGDKSIHCDKDPKQSAQDDSLVVDACVNKEKCLTATPTNVDLCCRDTMGKARPPRPSMGQSMTDPENSTTPEEVGEEKRDFVGRIGPVDPTDAPSSSNEVSNKNKKVLSKGKRRKHVRNNLTESTTNSEKPNDEERRKQVIRPRTGKVTRKGLKTSTPVTIKKGRKMRCKRRVTDLKKTLFESVKLKLDEGLLVNLST